MFVLFVFALTQNYLIIKTAMRKNLCKNIPKLFLIVIILGTYWAFE